MDIKSVPKQIQEVLANHQAGADVKQIAVIQTALAECLRSGKNLLKRAYQRNDQTALSAECKQWDEDTERCLRENLNHLAVVKFKHPRQRELPRTNNLVRALTLKIDALEVIAENAINFPKLPAHV